MDRKTINIDLDSLSMKKKSSRSKSSSKTSKKADDLEIKPSNVRQLLLEKLKEYKKKHKTMKSMKDKPRGIQNPYENYLEQVEKSKEKDMEQVHLEMPDNANVSSIIPKQLPPPPYSNMKNSNLPTFRSYMQNKTQKNYELPRPNNIPSRFKHVQQNTNNDQQMRESKMPKHIKSFIKRKLTLGKSPSRKIGIMITNQKTRKNIENFKLENRKTDIKTIKNYLKKHNIINHGTSCPALLLREMYENARLCGTVQNMNGKNLIDNYLNDEKS